MNIKEYEADDRGAAELLGEPSRRHPRRVARLVDAFEEFCKMDTDHSDRIYRSADGVREVYVVPPRTELAQAPDAACLVLVDHNKRTIALVSYFENYDADRPAEQRLAFEEKARQALG